MILDGKILQKTKSLGDQAGISSSGGFDFVKRERTGGLWGEASKRGGDDFQRRISGALT